jgi:hypothetical protein
MVGDDERTRARILFHTGILYGFEDGSRFTRPLYLEKLVYYPKIRFAMAHISWPWCEECMAVMGRMRAARGYNTEEWQSYVDLTPGTPEYIRKQAISNAIEMCGVDRLLFGSDASIPGDLSYQKRVLDMDLRILNELGLDETEQGRILSGTADELFPGVSNEIDRTVQSSGPRMCRIRGIGRLSGIPCSVHSKGVSDARYQGDGCFFAFSVDRSAEKPGPS